MKIENITDEDIKECLNIYNYYILNTAYTLEVDALDLKTFTERVHSIKKELPYIVIKDDNNHVLGYAYLHKFNERIAYKITCELSIYISNEHLNEHLGSLLLNKIEEIAKEKGIQNIVSSITSENKNSLKFHENHGYILEGKLNNIAYKFNTYISLYYFRKSIV